ncbi:hypothetical protein CAL7716_010320 [Calothrix sp. PCC 7716]|nr:hypothetical protein CAL7716_010320 [Calothrix sp. PCC 7716]
MILPTLPKVTQAPITLDRTVRAIDSQDFHLAALQRLRYALRFTCTGSEITGLVYRDKSPYLHYHVIGKNNVKIF